VAGQWKNEMEDGEARILWSFVAAAAILALVGWESYRYTVRVDEATEARKYSFEAQLVLDDVAARLVDAETGQRVYVLTEMRPTSNRIATR